MRLHTTVAAICTLLLVGCAVQAVKPIAQKNSLLPTSCPELSQIAPKDFGQTVLMLEATSQQYYICRKAAMADQQ